MLENKKVKTIYGEVYYSRFIASWHNIKSSKFGCFGNWLESLAERGIAELTDDDIRDIVEMNDMGKLELERDVLDFTSTRCAGCTGNPILCDE